MNTLFADTRFRTPTCVLTVLLWGLTTNVSHAVHPPVESLSSYPINTLFETTNGTIETVPDAPTPTLRWLPNSGQTAFISLRHDHPLFGRLRYYDQLDFEFRITTGEINSLGVEALGHVSGPRQYKMHQWEIALRTTERETWHHRRIDLARPNWFPWEDPDGRGRDGFFRFNALSLLPGTTLELRNIRLVRSLIILKPDYELPCTWPVGTRHDDGSVSYTMTWQVLNASGQPDTVNAQVMSEHSKFAIQFKKERVAIKAGKTGDFTLTATISAEAIAATPELYTEPLRISFSPAAEPNASCMWMGNLVRPLSKSIKRQVIISNDQLEKIRSTLGTESTGIRSALDYQRVIKTADAFLATDLVSLPRGHNHPRNNPVQVAGIRGKLKPGSFMPEAIDDNGQFREAGTVTAGMVWKEHMANTGQACERLGLAYLYTGDEKYAKKAVELFQLYAKEYKQLHWSFMGEVPWNDGPNILASSRIARTSTYGSNWYMKGHCRLASMTAESPAWTPEIRNTVYREFVIPYATEIMKFPGGISNMTDITNHNILLLGLVFDDAHMVRWATMTDPGLLSRLRDIDADGFSSEGRPTNYHFGAMNEFLPSIAYLERAGLPVQYDKKRLLDALRLPLRRAALTGHIPNTGDCGRWMAASQNPLAEHLIDIFPNEKWLFDIGASRLRRFLTRSQADVNAWKAYLEPTPRLFREAGLAILRHGDTPETQIMVTLDYGRNLFHAALDRNQVTLTAFGKAFSHGPGTVYNAGRGGMFRRTSAGLDSFCSHGSLGHNVVLIDATDQLRAVGELLAWNDQPEFQLAIAKVDGLQPGVSHVRGIILTRNVVILLDRLTAETERQFDFLYHNFGTLSTGPGWTATEQTEPLATTGNYESVKTLKELTGGDSLQLIWDLSNQYTDMAKLMGNIELNDKQKAIVDADQQHAKDLRLYLHQPTTTGHTYYTGITGMNNPNTAEVPADAPSLFRRTRGQTAEFVTVLEPSRGPSQIKSVSAQKGTGIKVDFIKGRGLTVSLDTLLKKYAVTE